MPLFLLNVKKVEAAKPKDKLYNLSDGGGLYLRVQPSGKKSWYYVYKHEKRQRWMYLGMYPDTPLYDDEHPELGARGKAEIARRYQARGLDPLEEIERLQREQEEAARREAERLAREAEKPQTVRELFNRWRSTELTTTLNDKQEVIHRGRKDNGAEVQRAFEKDVFPEIGDLLPGEVRVEHIMKVRDRTVVTRGVRRTANTLLSSMRQMFQWGLLRGYCQQDPTAGIKKEKFGGRDNERDRILGDHEITELAKRLRFCGGGRGLKRPTQIMLLLQLATACRGGELVLNQWKNVDFDERTIVFPAEIRKNNKNFSPKSHAVYLSDLSLSLLRELHRYTGHTDWLFPNKLCDGPLNEKTIAKQVGDRQRGEAFSGRAKNTNDLVLSGGKWVPHDLRRTAATLIVRLLIENDITKESGEVVAEKCLSHIDPSRVRRTYNRYGYEQDMKEAWDLLGKHLTTLIPEEALAPAPLPKKKPRPPGHAKAKQTAVESILDKAGAVTT